METGYKRRNWEPSWFEYRGGNAGTGQSREGMRRFCSGQSWTKQWWEFMILWRKAGIMDLGAGEGVKRKWAQTRGETQRKADF